MTNVTSCMAEDCKNNTEGACKLQDITLDGDFQCEMFDGSQEGEDD